MKSLRRHHRRAALFAIGLSATLSGGMLLPATTTATAIAAGPVAVNTSADDTRVAPGVGGRHNVSYDNYSFKLDGRRLMVQAAEFHYFRLPARTCGGTSCRSRKPPDSTPSRCTSTGRTTPPKPGCTTSPASGTWTAYCARPNGPGSG